MMSKAAALAEAEIENDQPGLALGVEPCPLGRAAGLEDLDRRAPLEQQPAAGAHDGMIVDEKNPAWLHHAPPAIAAPAMTMGAGAARGMPASTTTPATGRAQYGDLAAELAHALADAEQPEAAALLARNPPVRCRARRRAAVARPRGAR